MRTLPILGVKGHTDPNHDAAFFATALNLSVGMLPLAEGGGAVATSAVVSETRGAITNLGSRTVTANSEMWGHLAVGEGMSGVYDSATGKFILRPSSMAKPLPEGAVAQYGGHAAVRTDLAAALGEDLGAAAPGRLSGFSVTRGEGGTASFGWNSGMVNPASHGSRAVPEAVRPEIEAAVRMALGL